MIKLKKTTLYVKGMHCPSCEVLINDKFKEEKNIKNIIPDYHRQEVKISYTGNLNRDSLNQKIKPFGYEIVEENKLILKEPFTKNIIEIGIIAMTIFIVYLLAQNFNLLPRFDFGKSLSLPAVFILGLVASTSTCMATSGALFLATVGKLNNKRHPEFISGSDKIPIPSYSGRNDIAFIKNGNVFFPALSFNLGRVISYGFFGFVIGFIGKFVAYSLQLGGVLTLVVSIMMLLIGLDMLRIFSVSLLVSGSLTKNIFNKLEERSIKNPKKTAFFLGAITYFLPCGFTQTVQVYALSLANPFQSALTMIIFAIGTVPALLALGFAMSFTKSKFYPIFYKTIGVLIVILAIVYFGNFLNLVGINNPISINTNSQTDKAESVETNIEVKNGVQIARMTVNSSGYSPNYFLVKKNMPVKWIINGENVFGCQGYFVVPKLNFRQNLKPGENIIKFTPSEDISFSCGMGMYRGSFKVE